MDNSRSDETNLVKVLDAQSEVEAITIRSFLESQGIEAAIRSRQIPMYNGIAKIFNPVWGYVMVMEPDREKAMGLIEDYMESLEENDQGEET